LPGVGGLEEDGFVFGAEVEERFEVVSGELGEG